MGKVKRPGPKTRGQLVVDSDVNICADFVGKFSACLWWQATQKIFKFMFWSDLDI